MIDPHFFDDLSKKLASVLPESLRTAGKDIEKNFQAILQSAFNKLDLVTREEFDAQVAVLKRTREKIDQLEKEIQALQASTPKTQKNKPSTTKKSTTTKKSDDK